MVRVRSWIRGKTDMRVSILLSLYGNFKNDLHQNEFIVYIYNIGVSQREDIKKTSTLQEYLFKIDLKLDVN